MDLSGWWPVTKLPLVPNPSWFQALTSFKACLQQRSVLVQLIWYLNNGNQTWLGIRSSLAMTLFEVWKTPRALSLSFDSSPLKTSIQPLSLLTDFKLPITLHRSALRDDYTEQLYCKRAHDLPHICRIHSALPTTSHLQAGSIQTSRLQNQSLSYTIPHCPPLIIHTKRKRTKVPLLIDAWLGRRLNSTQLGPTAA
jgi:hypothetical protein